MFFGGEVSFLDRNRIPNQSEPTVDAMCKLRPTHTRKHISEKELETFGFFIHPSDRELIPRSVGG